MTKDEVSLIQRVQQGKDGAFEQLFQRYYGKAYAIAYRVMNSDADANDVAQETMMEIHRSLHRLKEPSCFYSWMTRIVISKCNRLYRNIQANAMDPQKIQAVQGFEEKRVYMLPEKEMENRADHDVVLGLIYTLKPQFSQALDMMYLKQMKLQEIAEELDISISTVKSRVVRGRIMLKQRIDEFERLEQRKISFHLNTPISLLGFSLFFHTIKHTFQTAGSHVVSYANGGVIQMACVISFAALAVSGTLFAIEDLNTETFAPYQEPTTLANKTGQINRETSNHFFTPTTYQSKHITSSIEAYYTCLNWALDEEEMMVKSKGEFDEILPVYTALKESNDLYFIQLTNRGWSSSFENFLQSF